MTRREIREEIFKAVFRADFHSEEEFPEQVELFIEDEEPPIIDAEDRAYIEEKSKAVIEHVDEFDEILNRVADGWTTKRMAKVDLALLRLALYEIRYEKIAEGIVINEAVELAKAYGTDNSSSFVNGVLGRIVRE